MAVATNNDDLIISISTDTSELVNAQKNAARQINATLASIEKAAIQAGNKIDNAFIDAGKAIETGIGSGSKQANSALKSLNNALSKQQQELAKVKASFPQATAAIERYESSVVSLKAAFIAGQATARQFQQGLERERLALLVNTSEMRRNQNAILARNKAAATPVQRVQTAANSNAAGASTFNTANIAAQFQDIAVTTAMGMSPLQIALQQGTQLSSVLTSMGNGRAVISGLAAAFTSLISPVSLVTIGLIAGGAALVQYLTSGKSSTKELEAVLKAHQQNIEDIKAAWGDAAKGLDDYNRRSPNRIRADSVIDQFNLTEQLTKQSKELADNTKGIFQNVTSSLQDQIRSISAEMFGETDAQKISAYEKRLDELRNALDAASKSAPIASDRFAVFKDEIDAFGKSVKEGNPQVVQFANAISEKINANPGSESIKKLGAEIFALIKPLEDVGLSLGQTAEGMKVMAKSAELSETQMKALNKQLDQYKEAMSSVAALSKIARPEETELDQIERNYQDALAKAPGNKAVEDAAIREREAAIKRYRSRFIINADGNQVAVPIPGQKPNRESQAPDKETKKQETAAEKAKKAYENLLTSISDRNEQMRQQISLEGQAAAATDAARVALETLQKAEKAGITGDRLEAIKQQVKLYQQLADTLAKTKLTQDLTNQSWMSSLSKDDQRVAQTLKQYGLPTDLNSQQANQIRQFNAQQDQREEITSFLSNVKNGVVSGGKNIGESLAESIRNALLNQADKLWDNLFQQIANSIIGTTAAPAAATTAATVSSRLLSPTPIAQQAVATTPVSNNLASYAAAIRKIESAGSGGYSALGPVLKSGDRAYGAYQVMGNNIPSWTKSALGYSMTPQQFLASSSAQDAVFNQQFGKSLTKYGNPQDAASVWFSGRPLSQAGNASDGFNTTPQYVTKFNEAISGATQKVGSFGTDLTQVGQSLLGGGQTSTLPAVTAPTASTAINGQATDMLSSITSSFTGLLNQIMSSLGGGIGGALSGIFSLFGFADGGQIGAKRAQGRVHGPGGPKADQVLLWGSNGEFMVNAEATRKNLPLLQAINSGTLLHRADGGIVSAPTAPRLRPNMAASNTNNRNPGTLNVHINGASGDAHIKTLVEQGVSSGLSNYNVQQARGGQGVLEAQYRNRKG